MDKGKKAWNNALTQEVTALPICELCGESEEPIFSCARAQEEYAVEEEHEHIDYARASLRIHLGEK